MTLGEKGLSIPLSLVLEIPQKIDHWGCTIQGWIFIFVENVTPQGDVFKGQGPDLVRRNAPNAAKTFFGLSYPKIDKNSQEIKFIKFLYRI